MAQIIFIIFFSALLAAFGITVTDTPIKAIVLIVAVSVALNLHKITK